MGNCTSRTQLQNQHMTWWWFFFFMEIWFCVIWVLWFFLLNIFLFICFYHLRDASVLLLKATKCVSGQSHDGHMIPLSRRSLSQIMSQWRYRVTNKVTNASLCDTTVVWIVIYETLGIPAISQMMSQWPFCRVLRDTIKYHVTKTVFRQSQMHLYVTWQSFELWFIKHLEYPQYLKKNIFFLKHFYSKTIIVSLIKNALTKFSCCLLIYTTNEEE